MVTSYIPLLVVALSMCLLVGLSYVANVLLAIRRLPLTVQPFLSGGEVSEHAMSRYHARWYTLSLLFLAFDVEMLFMCPPRSGYWWLSGRSRGWFLTA